MSQNALERFIGKTRELFAKEADLEKRWQALSPILAELLADPEVREASKSWPDCVPADGRAENLLFYEDPDYGFAINGLTKGDARQGGRTRIHDHAHIYTLYGVLDGRERIERYERIDDRSRPNYAVIKKSADVLVGPGEIDLAVLERDLHRLEQMQGNADDEVRLSRPDRDEGVHHALHRELVRERRARVEEREARQGEEEDPVALGHVCPRGAGRLEGCVLPAVRR